MKAISLKPHWAWLVTNNIKDIENRSRKTKILGYVFIHASKNMTRKEHQEGLTMLIDSNNFSLEYALEIYPKYEDMQRGGIIGMTFISDCVSNHFSFWFKGPYGYILENSMCLKFFPCKGQLGFFNVDY